MFHQYIGGILDRCLCIGIGFYLVYRSYHPRISRNHAPPEIAQRRANKSRINGIAIILFGMLLFGLFGWGGFGAVLSVRKMDRQLMDAQQATASRPLGDERAAEYIRRLNAVDSDNAPPEVQKALEDYISSMEQALEASEAHQDLEPFKKVCIRNGQELSVELNKYQ
jgi:hypothetical protein